MPFKLGTPELLILLFIVIILFGVGRVGKLGAELGKGIRELRRGLTSGDEDDKTSDPQDIS
jgi:sec-independent protein translocase protein TatA